MHNHRAEITQKLLLAVTFEEKDFQIGYDGCKRKRTSNVKRKRVAELSSIAQEGVMPIIFTYAASLAKKTIMKGRVKVAIQSVRRNRFGETGRG